MRRTIRHIPLLGTALAPAAAQAQGENRPMWYLETFGSPGNEITPILWGLLWLAIGVVVIIAALVLAGVFLKTRRGVDMRRDQEAVSPPHDHSALRWMYGGLFATLAALSVFVVWTMMTMADIRQPDGEAPITIAITGHQWWWQVTYLSEDESRIFETANEIHVPVGVPVKFRLTSADVIHSFWVPAIAGKTDLIPGQENTAWFRADTPGVYRGQCAEYCGKQHANMALRVVAESPEDFDAWWDMQLEPVEMPETEVAKMGMELFRLNCAACHNIRGAMAGGEMGPDLSHLMERTTLASGMLPNTPGHLSGWIANPDVIKPGTLMPRTDLSGPELDAIRAFLLTLDQGA